MPGFSPARLRFVKIVPNSHVIIITLASLHEAGMPRVR